MKCKNCGNEFEGNFCPNCGTRKENDKGFTFISSTPNNVSGPDLESKSIHNQNPEDFNQPVQPRKKNYKIITIVGIVCLAFLIIGIWATVFENDDQPIQSTINQSNSSSNIHSSNIQQSNQEEPQSEYTYDNEISYDGFSIVFSSEYYFTTIDNRFSEDNGKEVVVFPVTITNHSGETGQINIFDVTVFNSSGQENSSIDAYFDKGLISVGDIRDGATCEAEFYSIYDGDGDYYIELDGGFNSPNIEICLPVIK